MSDANTRIDQLVKSNDIVLFMKGSASFPMCGFSGRAIRSLPDRVEASRFDPLIKRQHHLLFRRFPH